MNTMPLNSEKIVPWNKDKLIGQKSPLKLTDIWAIRVRLQLAQRKRDLALFNLGIDSKLRGVGVCKDFCVTGHFKCPTDRRTESTIG